MVRLLRFRRLACALTCGQPANSMKRTSRLSTTTSGSDILSVTQRAGTTPDRASRGQHVFPLWAMLPRTRSIWGKGQVGREHKRCACVCRAAVDDMGWVCSHHCVDSFREGQQLKQFWDHVEIQQGCAELGGVRCVHVRRTQECVQIIFLVFDRQLTT